MINRLMNCLPHGVAVMGGGAIGNFPCLMQTRVLEKLRRIKKAFAGRDPTLRIIDRQDFGTAQNIWCAAGEWACECNRTTGNRVNYTNAISIVSAGEKSDLAFGQNGRELIGGKLSEYIHLITKTG